MGLTFTGSIGPGQRLILDLDSRRARCAGANVREAISGDWFLLQPGAQTVTIEAGPAPIALTVSVAYRERHG